MKPSYNHNLAFGSLRRWQTSNNEEKAAFRDYIKQELLNNEIQETSKSDIVCDKTSTD